METLSKVPPKRRRKSKATADTKAVGKDTKSKEQKPQGNIYDAFVKRMFSQVLVFVDFSKRSGIGW